MDDMIFSFKVETPPAWIPIGRTAENDWRTIEIDCSYWFNMNANGEVVLMYKPSCGMSPYPLLTERDGDNIVWRPKSGELVEGVGRLQAFFEVGTDVIGSSDMISCEVDSSLLGADPGTDPGQTDLPWALDIIEQIAELSGHYPKIIDGDLYIWDSTLNDWAEFEASGGGSVESVNGKTGVVVLDASDVGALPESYTPPVSSVNGKTGAVSLGAADVHALPDSTVIPPAVTEQTVAGWGFTKNTGTYSKPSGGIPASDLASGVIPTVPQMATEADMSDWTSGKTVDALTLKAYFEGALQSLDAISSDIGQIQSDLLEKADKTEIPTKVSDLTNDSNFQTAAQVQTAIAAIPDELPPVTSTDNGKVLGVVNGAWAVKSDEGGASVTVDSALSDTSENPVQNKVVKAALDGNVGKTTLLNLLIPILRQGLYGTDQEAAISALETALGGTPSVQTFVITNNLTNVMNSNEATAINSGSAYIATLTPNSGMEIQSITITMGGVDVTATVYSNGAISIASVTGNIVITAVAESMIETIEPTMIAGYYIVANGTEHDHSSYQRTPVIPCRAGDKVYGTCENSSYPGSTVNYIRARWTAAYDNNSNAIESAGSNDQKDYSQSSPYVVPSGVYGVVFSMVNALANNVVVYVDKSERVGA